jgi:energy-coupling factor transporter ATP-binding protein EcfA2
MFEHFQICPYTGLRSFTEEESLYFKGREDDIDQATAQLQKNKFLMLTGSSGDGKSSLIYAGIIPNARSGFLKSKYTQWCVADFRPERSPFDNLCKAISRQLDIANILTVEAELNHGFSALVDLYRNSKRYLDTQSEAWVSADEKQRGVIKREAANLIILVDQFEEFFTNPENYHQGVPSRESNLVLNLLLETARIALEEDLPIYVVFTMRSDYIGQCAAFRGLPEYLGFSQFFVPRLNRTQLQQVIEEPAKLSGNRITRRLTERLIHDINEGVDQLPILQHALNQIWVAADQGNEEMDLIHYAMVGGISLSELPDEQVERFNQWFAGLPDDIKKCYHEPNLQNVLDTHTNKLYEQAAGYYTAKTGKTISSEDAKKIIRTSFTCLTKIDQSRAVRNRMTLQEITQILGNPAFDTYDVGAVLNIFREPGNTFIHPFIIEDDTSSLALEPDQVLDITHESLIRNWKYLGQWAKEEYDSRSISLDFEQQLGRWVESDKSNDFLLSIGPLTYFEGWFNKVKPNAWWIARYLPEENTKENKLVKSKEILGNAQDFLKRSAIKHVITRTVMRYGPKKIAAVLGILAMIALSSFAVKSYFDKQNSAVLKSMHQQTLSLVDNRKVTISSKVALIAEEMKMGLTTVNGTIDAISDSVQKINMATGIATQLVYQGRGMPAKEISEALTISDSLLEGYKIPVNNPIKAVAVLKELNDLRATLELAYNYNADPQIDQWLHKNAKRSAQWVLHIVEQQPEGFENIQDLSLSMENAINYKAFSETEIDKLLNILSPFENPKPSAWLQSNFMQDKMLIKGNQNYGFFFNGLYQELAYLYAAKGNSNKALQCVDTLLKFSQNYYQFDYGACMDNAANIAAVFYSNGHADQLDAFVSGYCMRKKITEEEFYNRLLGRTIHDFFSTASLDLMSWMINKINLNLSYSRNNQLSFFFNKYRERIQATLSDPDQINLLTALSFKNEGLMKALHSEKIINEDKSVTAYFEEAVFWYRKVNPAYLRETEKIVGNSGADEMVVPRNTLFIYPDLRPRYIPGEPRSFFHYYFTDVFLKFILSKGLFDEFYTGKDELQIIAKWLSDYNVKMFIPNDYLIIEIQYELLQQLAETLEKRNAEQSQDFNLLYLNLGLEAQKRGDQTNMLRYYRKLQPEKLKNILQSKEFQNEVNNQAFRLMAFALKGFFQAGKAEEAHKIVRVFKKSSNRSSLYAFAAAEMQNEKKDAKIVQALIDSARNELNRTQNLTGFQPNRWVLSYALAIQDPVKNLPEINKLIKNLPQKLFPIQSVCRAYAFNNQLYNAQAYTPNLISDDDLALTNWFILYGYSLNGKEPGPEWKTYNQNYFKFLTLSINYLDESN